MPVFQDNRITHETVNQIIDGVNGAVPADIRTYPVAAGRDIAAGEVVDVTGGQVDKTYSKESGARVKIGDSYRPKCLTCRLHDGLFAYCGKWHPTGGATGGKLDMALFEAGEGGITAKTPGSFVLAADINNSIQDCLLVRLTDSSMALCYCAARSMYAKFVSVNGNTVAVTPSGKSDYGTTISSVTEEYCAGVPVSESAFLVFYHRSGLKARRCAVSGTAITPGAEYALPGTSTPRYIAAVRVDGQRICVFYADNSDGDKGKAVLFSQESLSFGTPLALSGEFTSYISGCVGADGKLTCVYQTSSGARARSLTADAMTLTAAEDVYQFPGSFSAASGVALGRAGDGTVVLGNGSGGLCLLKRDGEAFTLADSFKWGDSYGPSLERLTDGALVTCYGDGANYTTATAGVIRVRDERVAGGFTDQSSQAISLQDAEAGQDCRVIFSGMTPLPGSTEGREIHSPGVFGHCPMDGWIWVRPWWDGGIVVGGYTGDNTYPRTVVLGFRPRVLMLAGGKITSYEYPAFGTQTRNFEVSGQSYDYARITDDGFIISGGNANESYRTLNGTDSNVVRDGRFVFVAMR